MAAIAKALAATVASAVALWLADKGFLDEAARLEVEEVLAALVVGALTYFVPNRPARTG